MTILTNDKNAERKEANLIDRSARLEAKRRQQVRRLSQMTYDERYYENDGALLEANDDKRL